ncbi:hypothetical protein ACFW1A_38145, partial [Kitasatospora sp. NPDC058965]|uniref:hypothetical protein n=1 Tax=Kitasatospora sp. NPDC058965 TaxID=3346682 RepID=UPI0036CE42CF
HVIEPRENAVPDPGQATDLARFVELLERLRIWGGDPSFRTLARRVGPLLRPPQEVSKSTVADLFRPGRRRLNQELVVAVVRALGLDERAVRQWRAACVRVHARARTASPAQPVRPAREPSVAVARALRSVVSVDLSAADPQGRSAAFFPVAASTTVQELLDQIFLAIASGDVRPLSYGTGWLLVDTGDGRVFRDLGYRRTGGAFLADSRLLGAVGIGGGSELAVRRLP